MACSRRSFIKQVAGMTGAGVLTGAGVTTAASAAEANGAEPWLPAKWDIETDVVVIGTGSIAGSALRAHEEGLDVVVLEKHPSWFGGTTALCGGGMSCPNSTLALQGGAPEIPREDIKSYLMEVAEGQSSEEVIDMMIDNYAPAVDFLISCGVEFACSEYSEDYEPSFNIYRQGDFESKYAKVPCTVFIGMHSSGVRQGRAIAAFMKDAFDARNIPVLFGAPATKLIYAGNPALGDGEVIGVWAKNPDGEDIAIKARYGVIIGTGGFDHNRELVRSYINAPIYSTCAIETNTGDGLVMGMEVGADLRNMSECYGKVFNMAEGADVYVASDLSRATEEMFSGGSLPYRCVLWPVRLHPRQPPGTSFLQRGRQLRPTCARVRHLTITAPLKWCNIPGFLVMDSTCKTSLGSGLPSLPEVIESGELPEYLHRFDTLEELAEGMGIDAEGLLATVERWNGFCAEGADA